jgi:hypothetical protein
MTPFRMKLGWGAGELEIEAGPHVDTYAINFAPSHGGTSYRLVGVSAAQLTELAIALAAIPDVATTLKSVRALLPG